MKIINAEGLIMGRLASHVAKALLDGEEIAIVNAEKAILTGSKKMLMAEFKKRRKLVHARKGPYYPRMPDRILKRSVRGMIPYQKPHGRQAFKRLKVYIGLPAEFKDEKLETIETAALSDARKYMHLGDISKGLGAKF